MHPTIRSLKILSTLALVLALAAPAIAAPAAPVADTLLGTTQVQWVPNQQYAALTLAVSGPAGVVERTFEPGEDVVFDLAAMAGDVDGAYSWQLTATPRLDAELQSALGAARTPGGTVGEPIRPSALPPAAELIQSGFFTVRGGGVVQPADEAEAPASDLRVTGADGVASAQGASSGLHSISAADQVILDDLIVDGSACIGQDCVNGENFGFDTIRIKENNTRIKFDDTSNSVSFPNTDWELVANDSSNGGRNAFYIQDVTNGREVFTLEATAPSHSLYVDDAGNLGLGTNAPAVEVHVKDGDSPTLRLQQDGSAGFTQQIWDVAGNESNFFVRDVTNGSLLPFKIRPGAPTDSLVIAADGTIEVDGTVEIGGRVGVGTTSPSADATLHMVTAGPNRYRLENSTAGTQWDAINDGNGDFSLSLVGSGSSELEIEQDGDIGNCGNPDHDFVISVGPACTATPRSWMNAGDTGFSTSSSRTYKENVRPLHVPSILDKVREIEVYEYDFVGGPGNRIGLMAEDFHRIFARGSDKDLSGHEMQLALWLAVQELADTAEQLKDRDRQIEELMERVTALEGSGRQVR